MNRVAWKSAGLIALLASCTPDQPEVAPSVTPPAATVAKAEIPVQAYRITNLTRSEYQDGYPSFSPDGTRLAFSSVRNGNRDLYMMTLATGAIERLTEHPADDGGPAAWSHDGGTLYFRSKRQGTDYNIYQLDLATRTVKRLTTVEGGEGYVDVSPDGQSIAFHSERDQAENDRNLEVYVMHLGSGAQSRVTTQRDKRNGGPDWLPGGKRLINVARGTAGSSVQITDLDGVVLAEYAATDKEDTFIGSLGPFGKRFVFYSNREGGAMGLYLLELNSGELTRITTGPATFSTPQFSPGGRYIALQYDDGGPSDVALLDLGQPISQAYAANKD